MKLYPLFIPALKENFVSFNFNFSFWNASSILVHEWKQISILELISSLNEANLFRLGFMFG